MTEQLQIALADILVKAIDTVETAGAFIAGEVPDVVTQLLAWKMWESLLIFLFSICLLIVAYITGRNAMTSRPKRIAAAKDAYDRGEGWTRHGGKSGSITSIEYDAVVSTGGLVTFILLGISLTASVYAIILCELTWLQILIAPKIYLIEYASELIK